ncbi:adenylosuccinate synthase [Paragonimus westermani]|uniref:Adenylosuccinate synthetase n=1 Tax=Paragonimus westermani TaxID=34504 RepID=A0A5J4NPM4_9TREM|nr:adenylosuccinate synthase [Paragonimus westermani]
MSNVVVVTGAQWGDEGKGKLVDLLSENANVVCRCQGGNNAGMWSIGAGFMFSGHTVVRDGQEFFFHLIPSGMVNPGALGIIGNGTVVNLPGLFEEIKEATSKGLLNLEKRLHISDRCHIVFDLHQAVDKLEEEIRGTGSIGTTKKGIGPAYSSKITRNGIRMCDLLGDWENLVKKYTELVKYAERRYPKLNVNIEDSLEKLKHYRQRLSGMVCDSVTLINKLASDPECMILVEGAQSCMLDVDFGTYPHVTSSNCTIGGVCTGLGLPPAQIGSVYGVVKAYTTRVGSGPFPTELHDSLGEQLQQIGREWGVTTKRRRRVGWLDTVIVRYAHMINHFTALALTKLDILDGLKEVRIGRAYVDQETGRELPAPPADSTVLNRVTVVYETLPGWSESTRDCTSFDALPEAARQYVLTVERLCGVPIRWIGTGAPRTSMIVRWE